MKKLVLVATCVLSLASVACTSNDVIDNADNRQTNEIGFSTAVSRGTSRAINSISDLKSFYVYGSQESTTVFNAQLVSGSTSDANSTAWDYTYNLGTTKPKWVAGSNYKFFAYSYDNSAVATGVAQYTPGTTTGSLKFEGFTTKSGDGTGDLIYSAPDAIFALQSGNSRVPFSFSHILSQVSLVFQNNTSSTSGTTYSVKISDIKVTGYNTKGNYDGNGTWGTLSDAASNVAINTAGASLAAQATETASSLFVIPQTIPAGSTITLTATITNNSNASDVTTYEYTATLTGEWKIGKKYQYTVPVTLNDTEEYINFTVSSIDGWGDTINGGTLTLTKTKK